MAKIKVFHDREGRTLTVWFDNPATEHVCEEVDDDLVLMKNKEGRVIGFEQLNYEKETNGDGESPLGVAVEVQSV